MPAASEANTEPARAPARTVLDTIERIGNSFPYPVFSPVFVPRFVQLSVDPAAVLAAYRVGDDPVNSITPLNP